jgi:hypothetical protein
MKTVANVATIVVVMTGVSSAFGQAVSWTAPSAYDSGTAPAIGISAQHNGLEVHQAFNPSAFGPTPLWVHSSGGTVGNYDSGYGPRIAGDTSSDNTNPTFVEVHVDESFGWERWYRMAVFDGGGVSFFGSNHYGPPGFVPAVAEASIGSTLRVVEVHEGANLNQSPPVPSGGLRYMTGTAQSDGTVSWGGETVYDGGYNPTVAMLAADPSHFFVVEVHRALGPGPQVGPLWFRTGTLLTTDTTITWSGSIQYDNGEAPSVAICSNPGGTPTVVEVHSGGDGTIWLKTGQIDLSANTVTGLYTTPAQRMSIGAGSAPSVACAGNIGVEVHMIHPDPGSGTGTLVRSLIRVN